MQHEEKSECISQNVQPTSFDSFSSNICFLYYQHFSHSSSSQIHLSRAVAATILANIHYKKRDYQRGPYALAKIQILSQKVISEGIWPSKAFVFALVVKRDFATIPSQIDNLRGQSTIVIEKFALTNILPNDEKSRRLIFSERKPSLLTTICEDLHTLTINYL